MIDISDVLISNLYTENLNHQATLNELAKTSRKIEIICPFVSNFGGQWIEDRLIEGKEVSLLTEISSRALLNKVLSFEALKRIYAKGAKISFMTNNLHAKLYWFDRKTILITSANLTENGLLNNVEVGVLLKPGILNPSVVRLDEKSLLQHIDALFRFFYKEAVPFDHTSISAIETWMTQSHETICKFSELKQQIEDVFETTSFIPIQRRSINKQNLTTDILLTDNFKGFDIGQWNVFDHNLDLNEENLSIFRENLDRLVNPILKSLFDQLKNEPIFSKNLEALSRGFSQNRMLKTRFPNDRYIFLTLPENGKLSTQHIKFPSYVLGMGKDRTGNSKWLEIRCGVEEDFISELSEYGENLLKNLVANADEVVSRLWSLNGDWTLTHGKGSTGRTVALPVHAVNQGLLKVICNGYLQSRDVADIQIRRKYRWDSEKDKIALLSPKITRLLAEDLMHLTYFFDLAHR